MSTNLFWRPPPVPPEDFCLSRALKYRIAPKLWGHDGTLSSEWTDVGVELLPYLDGLIDASCDEDLKKAATTLKLAIEEHGTVQICTQ